MSSSTGHQGPCKLKGIINMLPLIGYYDDRRDHPTDKNNQIFKNSQVTYIFDGLTILI